MAEPTVTISSSLGLGAAEIVRAIAAGALTPRTVVDEHIARIEAVNPGLNAVVLPRFREAREAAAACESRRARRPLEGLPVTLKESLDLAGLPTTAGIGGIRAPARADGEIARRLGEAGAIVLGKTNVPQLLLFHESDNPVYGCARNPWRPDRTPGGSSGGEAAIIAAGGSPLGIGTDIGGSIRVPAHFSGIHGLKPTAGRLPLTGSFDATMFPNQDAIPAAAGPLGRRVEDLALALRVLADEPVPLRDPREVSVARLRLAWYADDGFFPAAPAVARAVREAAGALRQRGAIVEEFRPPDVPRAVHLFYRILSADGAAWARQALRGSRVDRRIRGLLQLAGLPGRLRPALAALVRGLGQQELAWLIESLGARPADEFRLACAERERYRLGFLAALDAGRYDALVCPPHALPALRHGSSYFLGPAASYSMLYNFLDMPAGVVAASRVRPDEEGEGTAGLDVVRRAARRVRSGSAGLPVGVQVAARPWREDLVLAVMAALEEHFAALPGYPAGRLLSV